jgi:hypothetical protein
MNEFFIKSRFVSDEDCDGLVEFINSLPEETFTQKRDGRLTICDQDLAYSTNFINKYTPNVQDILNKEHEVRTFFLSVYPPGAGMLPHLDEPEEELKNDMGVVYILNDNFTGGEIYLPTFQHTYHPTKGDAVFFPINSYYHEVTKVLSGVRYTVPLQYSNLEGQALPFLLDKSKRE